MVKTIPVPERLRLAIVTLLNKDSLKKKLASEIQEWIN